MSQNINNWNIVCRKIKQNETKNAGNINKSHTFVPFSSKNKYLLRNPCCSFPLSHCLSKLPAKEPLLCQFLPKILLWSLLPHFLHWPHWPHLIQDWRLIQCIPAASFCSDMTWTTHILKTFNLEPNIWIGKCGTNPVAHSADKDSKSQLLAPSRSDPSVPTSARYTGMATFSLNTFDCFIPEVFW